MDARMGKHVHNSNSGSAKLKNGIAGERRNT